MFYYCINQKCLLINIVCIWLTKQTFGVKFKYIIIIFILIFYLTANLINIKSILKKEVNPNDMSGFVDVLVNLGNSSYTNEHVQKFIMDTSQKFDAVIVEWLFSELSSG